MKSKKAVIVVCLLVGLSLAFPLSTTSQSGITVTGADSILNTSSTHSSDLVSTTLSISPRVAIEYAHSTELGALSSEIPASLQDRIAVVSARVTIEYAHSSAPYVLSAMSTGFQALVNSVLERVAVEYACSTHGEELVYPLELIGDTTPPQISDVAVSSMEGDGVNVTWTTDEFATSTVLYGIQTGVYTNTVSDPLYVKRHKVILPEMASGTMHYYQVSSTDRSGNTATSSEYSLTAQSSIYLPVVIRNQ